MNYKTARKKKYKYNSRMAQATKWLPAILDYMKKVKLNISTCLASFPTRTANYLSLNWYNLTLHTVRPAYGRGHQRYKTARAHALVGL